ncbi:MAG: hypothetical protein ACR2M3_07310 [Thermomicrobiales bacterium]
MVSWFVRPAQSPAYAMPRRICARFGTLFVLLEITPFPIWLPESCFWLIALLP